MRRVTLGDSSINVSKIGLGALHFGVYFDKKESINIIRGSVDRGVNFIDTAPMYGNGFSEQIVGDAIKDIRNEIVVSSKVGLEPITRKDGTFGVQERSLTKKNIIDSVEMSLRSIGTDYLDLLQIHAYDYSTNIDELFDAPEFK